MTKVILPQSQITLHIILFKGYPHFFALSFSILAARSWDKVRLGLFRLSNLWFPLTVSSFCPNVDSCVFLFPSGLFCSWLIFHFWSQQLTSQLICRADDCVDSLKAVNKHNFLTQHYYIPVSSLNTYRSNLRCSWVLELNSSLLGQPQACTYTMNHNRGFHLQGVWVVGVWKLYRWFALTMETAALPAAALPLSLDTSNQKTVQAHSEKAAEPDSNSSRGDH